MNKIAFKYNINIVNIVNMEPKEYNYKKLNL